MNDSSVINLISAGCEFESRRGRLRFMENREEVSLLIMLLSRLERISADSHCAHLASGVRGALLRRQEQIEAGRALDESSLRRLVKRGFEILEDATREKAGNWPPGEAR